MLNAEHKRFHIVENSSYFPPQTESNERAGVIHRRPGFFVFGSVLLATAAVCMPNHASATPSSLKTSDVSELTGDVKFENAVKKCSTTTPPATRPTLALGDRGSCVKLLQAELVRHGSALPGEIDGVYGERTRRNVITFQIRNNIKNTAGQLGTGETAKFTWAALSKASSNRGLPPICKDPNYERMACTDNSRNFSYLFRKGKLIRRMPSMGGMRENVAYASDNGVFSVHTKLASDWSNEFSAPMSEVTYFTQGGEAYHAGDINSRSHGCQHLTPKDAKFTRATLKIGDPVVVVGG